MSQSDFDEGYYHNISDEKLNEITEFFKFIPFEEAFNSDHDEHERPIIFFDAHLLAKIYDCEQQPITEERRSELIEYFALLQKAPKESRNSIFHWTLD